jgi:hypothetical protein
MVSATAFIIGVSHAAARPMACAGDAVQRLVPIVEGRHAEPLDGGRGVAELRGLLGERHPPDEIVHAPLNWLGGIGVDDGCRDNRRQRVRQDGRLRAHGGGKRGQKSKGEQGKQTGMAHGGGRGCGAEIIHKGARPDNS